MCECDKEETMEEEFEKLGTSTEVLLKEASVSKDGRHSVTQMEAELVSVDSGSCGASADNSSGYGTQKTSTQLMTHREEKKERVKQCLRELNSLMPQGSQRKGLLGTLQQVVQRMKEIKETEQTAASADLCPDDLVTVDPTDPSSMPCLEPLEAQPMPILLEDSLSPPPVISFSSQSFEVVMSVSDSIIYRVSESLMELLEYPKDYWLNQSLLDFIRKHDLATFTSCLSQCRAHHHSAEGEDKIEVSQELHRKPVYFKLRHYKSLRAGFNLMRPDRFAAFRGQFSLQKLHIPGDNDVGDGIGEEVADKEVESCMLVEEEPLEEGVEPIQNYKEYLVLECSPLTSAYTEPSALPKDRTFLTKHTVFCNYCMVDRAAIPLLGYLPQDMVNTTIFNYYHPSDLPLLFTIYQQVVSNPGQKYHSMPYRMRAQNGDYLLIETEWTCNINPWTKQWDAIVGQHTVLRGPDNPDVFATPGIQNNMMSKESPDISAMEKLIKKLLLQPIQESEVSSPGVQNTETLPLAESKAKPSQEVPGTVTKHLPGSSSESGMMSTDSFLEEAIKLQEKEEDEDSAASIPLSEDDLSVLYEGLSYASNIRRYLMSNGSSADYPEGHYPEGSGDGDGSSCTQEALTVDVELPLPARIPSQASSTKALVSEHEREELAPPSPAHEDAGEETHRESASTEAQGYTPIRLSTDALKVHDKIHERTFIEKMMKEKAGYLLSQAGTRMLKTLGRTNQKRHQQDIEQEEKIVSSKMMRSEDGKPTPALITSREANPLLQPPFPITSLETHWTLSTPSNSTAFRFSTPHQSGVSCSRYLGTSWSSTPLTSMPHSQPSMAMAQHPHFTMPNMVSTPSSPMFRTSVSQAAMMQNSMLQSVAGSMATSRSPVFSVSTQQAQMATGYWPFYTQHAVPVFSPILSTGQQPPSMFTSGFVPPQSLLMGQMGYPTTAIVGMPPAGISPVDHPQVDPNDLQNRANNAQRGQSIQVSGSGSQCGPGPPASTKPGATQPVVPSVASAVDMDFSTDCTDSSLLYLLETSTGTSQNHSSNGEEESGDRHEVVCKRGPSLISHHPGTRTLPKETEPPWKMMVNWNDDMQMRYTVPGSDPGDLLKQDSLALKRLKQPHQLTQQLDELLSFLSGSDEESESQDEDMLLMSECSIDYEKEEGEPEISITIQCPPAVHPKQSADAESPELSSSDSSPVVSDGNQGGADACEDTNKEMMETQQEERTARSDSDLSCESIESPGRPKSADKLSENDVSDSSESGLSKAFSDLTPSDNRSNEEAGSSMKESDNASSSGSIGKDNGSNLSSESENDGNKNQQVKSKTSARKKQDYFSKLFVPIKVRYDESSKQAAWLQEANFGEHTQMLYQQPHTRTQQDILIDDKHMLNVMDQPDLVRMQMNCLLQELQGSEGESPSSSSLSSREDCDQPESMLSHGEQSGGPSVSMALSTGGGAMAGNQLPKDCEMDSGGQGMGYEGMSDLLTDSSIQSYNRQHREAFAHGSQSNTSGFCSMSVTSSSGKSHSSSSGMDKNGGSSSNGASDKTGSGSGSASKNSSNSSDKDSSGKGSSHASNTEQSRSSEQSNSDPDSSDKRHSSSTKVVRSSTESKAMSPGLVATPVGGPKGVEVMDTSEGAGLTQTPVSRQVTISSSGLSSSVVEKLDTVMSVFSLKEAMEDSEGLELLQE